MSPNYQYYFWKIMEWGLTYPYYYIFEKIQINQAGIAYKGYQLPEPWNGDIENADVIFVGLNPSYNPEEFYPHDVSIVPNSYWAAQKGRNVKVINGIKYDQTHIEDFYENRFSSYIGGKPYVDKQLHTLQQNRVSYSKLPVKYWQYAQKLIKEGVKQNAVIGKDFAFLEIIPCKSKSSEGLNSKLANGNSIQDQYIDDVFYSLLIRLCSDKKRTFIVLGKNQGGERFLDVLIKGINKGLLTGNSNNPLPNTFAKIWEGDKGSFADRNNLGKPFQFKVNNIWHDVIFWPHPGGLPKGCSYQEWEKRMIMNNTNPNKQQWCKEKAEQFFSIKKPTKRYPVEAECQDEEETLYLVLTDEEVKRHSEFQGKERKAFLDDNADGVNDEKAWREWLKVAYREEFNSGLFDTISLDETREANITMVHLDKGVNVYAFDVRYYETFNMDVPMKRIGYVELADNDYITLLAAVLENPNISVASLYFSHSAIFGKIANALYREDMECAVFMTEVRNDANRILTTV